MLATIDIRGQIAYMTQVYLLKNQNNEFLNRSGEWVNSGEEKALFKTIHKDEAINQRVEYAVKHPELRINIETVSLNQDGKLVLCWNKPLLDTL